MIEKIVDSLNEISIGDLRKLQEIIDNTIESRNKNAEEKAWNEVTIAIKNYCSSFGSIEFHICGDEFYINSDDNFSETGKIFPEY